MGKGTSAGDLRANEIALHVVALHNVQVVGGLQKLHAGMGVARDEVVRRRRGATNGAIVRVHEKDTNRVSQSDSAREVGPDEVTFDFAITGKFDLNTITTRTTEAVDHQTTHHTVGSINAQSDRECSRRTSIQLDDWHPGKTRLRRAINDNGIVNLRQSREQMNGVRRSSGDVEGDRIQTRVGVGAIDGGAQ